MEAEKLFYFINLIISLYLFASSSEPSDVSSSSLVNFLLLAGFFFLRGTLLWPGRFEGGGGDPFKSLSLSELSEFHESLKITSYHKFQLTCYTKNDFLKDFNHQDFFVITVPSFSTFPTVSFSSFAGVTIGKF